MATKKTRTSKFKNALKSALIWSKSKIPSSSSILNFLSVLISAGALWYSAKSAEAAINAVQLQRQQSIEASKQDSVNNLRDSAKYVESVKLTQEQIEALKQQVNALKEADWADRISKEPYLDAILVGFYNGIASEDYTLNYQVTNYGNRPAVLREATIQLFDDKFSCISKKRFIKEDIFFSQKLRHYETPIIIDGKEYSSINFQLFNKLNTFYVCISLKFLDTANSKRRLVSSQSKYFKWYPGGSFSAYSVDDLTDVYCHSLTLCSAYEIEAMSKSISAQNCLMQ